MKKSKRKKGYILEDTLFHHIPQRNKSYVLVERSCVYKQENVFITDIFFSYQDIRSTLYVFGNTTFSAIFSIYSEVGYQPKSTHKLCQNNVLFQGNSRKMKQADLLAHDFNGCILTGCVLHWYSQLLSPLSAPFVSFCTGTLVSASFLQTQKSKQQFFLQKGQLNNSTSFVQLHACMYDAFTYDFSVFPLCFLRILCMCTMYFDHI